MIAPTACYKVACLPGMGMGIASNVANTLNSVIGNPDLGLRLAQKEYDCESGLHINDETPTSSSLRRLTDTHRRADTMCTVGDAYE